MRDFLSALLEIVVVAVQPDDAIREYVIPFVPSNQDELLGFLAFSFVFGVVPLFLGFTLAALRRQVLTGRMSIDTYRLTTRVGLIMFIAGTVMMGASMKSSIVVLYMIAAIVVERVSVLFAGVAIGFFAAGSPLVSTLLVIVLASVLATSHVQFGVPPVALAFGIYALVLVSLFIFIAVRFEKGGLPLNWGIVVGLLVLFVTGHIFLIRIGDANSTLAFVLDFALPVGCVVGIFSRIFR